MIIYHREHSAPMNTNYAAAVSSSLPSTSKTPDKSKRKEAMQSKENDATKADKDQKKGKSPNNSKPASKKSDPEAKKVQDQRQIPTLISNSRFNALVDYADDDMDEASSQSNFLLSSLPEPARHFTSPEEDRQSRLRKRDNEERSRSASRQSKKGKADPPSHSNSESRKRRCP